ncbi:MAG: double-strand break repair helicase AddA [Janthinobacterium lividum]
MNVMPSPGPFPTASTRAAARQLEASDPTVSAFVAASAGSGKTKLLIDRLLRLMLAGADPARIQCLTFTNAAAAEMATRLQTELGQWVTLDDDGLRARLAQLEVTPDLDGLAKARALFARVLDLPGGMRIGTIHAFCQSLLRRFPLEAKLSPHFRLMEDLDGQAELEGAREDAMAHADPRSLAILAGLVNAAQFGQLVASLRPHHAMLKPLLDSPVMLPRLRNAFGVSGTDASLVQDAVAWPAEITFRDAVLALRNGGTPGEIALAERMFDWLNLPPPLRVEHWDQWLDIMLTGEGKQRAPGAFCKGRWSKAHPDIGPACMAECERVYTVEDQRRALRAADATAALLTLAGPVLSGFAARKTRSGLLDYDDLIASTSALLLDPGAAWVLFKLDGGLDHLLLDEVQDTAPTQWDIAGALTAEFFAGNAARDGGRTVFAVGDRKQSIYSFQGADPAGFDLWRDRMRNRVTASGGAFRDTELDVSFRSTAPVLALVDAVFEGPAGVGVVEPGATLRHEAHRVGQAGRVELWPLVPRPDTVPHEPWEVAERNHGLTSAPQRLADALAHWIAAQIGNARLESRDRTLAAGDVLILVRRRDDFARALVRRLKGLGVPVAGLDRLYLTDQPAVQDLLALCDTLLLPADDLSLACVLTSPLGDLTDDDLMELAVGRTASLWETLRQRAPERPEWQAAWNLIAALLARVDYVAPHALLSEALGPLGGRARLLRRLGPEAAEPIDELLSAALTYAGSHAPSLQGFVHRLRQSGAEVKRQAEEAGGVVRIMTVHGAKGLQAPLVILPDTTSLPPDGGGLVWPEPGLPLWSPRAELRSAVTDALKAKAKAARMEEYNRLLYVALTRAEDRLVVCGWETRRQPPDECWYTLVAEGLRRLSPEAEPLADVGLAWPGEILVCTSPQRTTPRRDRDHAAVTPAPMPAWAGSAPDWRPAPPPVEPARPIPVAPSRPAEAVFGPTPDAESPLVARSTDAIARGALVHQLLQHVPNLPMDEREEAVHAFTARAGIDVADEVLAVLAHPALAALFGPGARAEQPLTGVVDGVVVSGLVDRLIVLPHEVVVADYKTNRNAPEDAATTPTTYLRQMAAYRAILRRIFPDRPVRCVLVWTRTARVMELPENLLDSHAPGA